MQIASSRQPEKIKEILKEINGQVITTKGCKIRFPVRYETVGLALVGSDTRFYGLFKISTLDDTYYGIHNGLAMIHSEPDDIDTENINDEPYYILTYDPGSVVIKDVNILNDNALIGKVYKEIIKRGKVPYFVTYEDAIRIFATAKEYAGASIGNSFELLAIPISIIARNPNDPTQYYREILNDVDTRSVLPMYVPASSVNFSATSALTKITGSYFYTGVVSAINNPTEQIEILDYVLRY